MKRQTKPIKQLAAPQTSPSQIFQNPERLLVNSTRAIRNAAHRPIIGAIQTLPKSRATCPCERTKLSSRLPLPTFSRLIIAYKAWIPDAVIGTDWKQALGGSARHPTRTPSVFYETPRQATMKRKKTSFLCEKGCFSC